MPAASGFSYMTNEQQESSEPAVYDLPAEVT